VRPISGTVANLGVLFALTQPGDTISTCSVADGAHISTAVFGAVGVRGLKPVSYPFDLENMNIDVEKTKKMLKETRPKLALFGMSVFLFPTPIEELKDTLDEIGATVWYDAAHVLGLIAGGEFQDPLREGVDIVTGSTHKTLPGPQRGILFGNPRDEEMKTKLDYGMFPGVLSNHHLHTMAALAVTLAEHIEFGREYAKQIVRNAQALGQALYERGFDVVAEHLGFTRSHTLAMYIKRYCGGKKAVEDLERANIITNKNLMPGDHPDMAHDPSGIRLGSQEMTRIGMKEKDMDTVAEFFKRILIDKEKPEKVREDVIEFKKDFKTIHYCFKEGSKAYEFPEILFK
ncbi:MAG TPA: serine hydroxymethyltransferase, partial [Thermoplasmata archaeon]|nr:serine hydroxymethyltransferase [Thermoplasmata archaeon]